MTQPTVRVECYSGYKADERPTRLHLGTHSFEITQIEDRWYEPGATFFRLLLEDGDRYVLRHEEPQDVWTIAGYRAGAALTQELHAAYSQPSVGIIASPSSGSPPARGHARMLGSEG